MLFSIAKTSAVELEGLPDLTFPPKYTLSLAQVETTHNGLEKEPSEPDEHVPVSEVQETTENTSKPSTLLTIPLEIRLHMYSYVLASNPIFHAHLAPPPDTWSTSVVGESQPFSSIGTSQPPKAILTAVATPAPSKAISALCPMSSPSLAMPRGSSGQRGKIPTGLLSSCRQIFDEAHLLPWEINSYSFINWFWSGVYASRQFTRGLRPWQSSALRWAGIEVLGRDLDSSTSTSSGMVSKWGAITEENSDAQESEWSELCGLWKGVWGLRLGIKGSVLLSSRHKQDYVEEDGIWVRPDEISMMENTGSNGTYKKDRGILDIERPWIAHCLLKLRSLRWIEIEIEDADVERDEKLLFCAELEEALNARKDKNWEGVSRVVFIERVNTEASIQCIVPVGDPGDDLTWALDMS